MPVALCYAGAMLQVGPFDDFKGENVLLIWGDAEGVATLFEKLEALASGHVREAEVGRGTSPAILSIVSRGEAGSTLSFADETIVWTLSEVALNEALQLVSALCEAERGHQYLDIDGQFIRTVMVSKGEYPPVMPIRVAR